MQKLTLGILLTVVTGSVVVLSALQGPEPRPQAPVTAPTMASSHLSQPSAATLSLDASTALVAKYCSTCHSERGEAGGLTLASFDAINVVAEGPVAEKMIRKLRTGMMPPPGAKRPGDTTLLALASALETHLDKAWAANPNPASYTVVTWRDGRRVESTVRLALGPYVEPKPTALPR